MGTWGIGLYANDLAQDLREDFRSACRAPWDGDQLLAWVRTRYPGFANRSDPDYFDLRLAMADLLWTYGIEHPEAYAVARAIVEDGSDLAVKRSLGMTERDLARRANVLAELGRRLSVPNARPKSRHILTRPQAYLLDVGECLVYPTSQGKARNPYVGARQEEQYYRVHPWRQDGWGAVIVLNRYRKYEVFARYVFALLAGDENARLEATDFKAMNILHTRSLQFPTRRRVQAAVMTRQHLERMRLESVGSLDVDEDRVAAEFSPAIREFARFGDDASLDGNTRGLLGPISVHDPLSRYLRIPTL